MWIPRQLDSLATVLRAPLPELMAPTGVQEPRDRASESDGTEQRRPLEPAGPSWEAWSAFSRLLALVLQGQSPLQQIHRMVAGLSLLPNIEQAALGDHPCPRNEFVQQRFSDEGQERWVWIKLRDPQDRRGVRTLHEMLELFDTLYQQARNTEVLLSQAHTDPLTGLWNRRAFAPMLEQAVARWQRGNEQVALLAIDVDHFKAINDQLGHDGGDRALLKICEVLRESCRPSDTLARLGGDELSLLLSGSDALGAQEVARRIQEKLAKVQPPRGPRLSVSIGISDSSCLDRDLGSQACAELQKSADRALYEVKLQGRGHFLVDSRCESPLAAPSALHGRSR